MWDKLIIRMLKLFGALLILRNYFDSPTELFSDLYLVKFLNTSVKPFFPCGRGSKKRKVKGKESSHYVSVGHYVCNVSHLGRTARAVR